MKKTILYMTLLFVFSSSAFAGGYGRFGGDDYFFGGTGYGGRGGSGGAGGTGGGAFNNFEVPRQAPGIFLGGGRPMHMCALTQGGAISVPGGGLAIQISHTLENCEKRAWAGLIAENAQLGIDSGQTVQDIQCSATHVEDSDFCKRHNAFRKLKAEKLVLDIILARKEMGLPEKPLSDSVIKAVQDESKPFDPHAGTERVLW